ncbi:MAG: hypothetical protein U0270_23195 [Labilithrix sp.]
MDMHHDPKRDAQKTEEAGFTGLSEEAPSVANPSIDSVKTPPQGPVTQPRPSKQDRLDLERSSGEGMTPPTSDR